MRKTFFIFVVSGLAVGLLPQLGWAQTPQADRGLTLGTTTFNVRNLDFDLWCQQTQRYAADRCAARRPEDLKAFDDYRASIERYELDFLKQQQREQEVRTRINRDPSQTVTGKQDGQP
jgi:hypothetical protein